VVQKVVRTAATGADRRRYVIQVHRATLLHYDLRLEQDGVVRSWAFPQGPSLVPGERRLAVETEDHPLKIRLDRGGTSSCASLDTSRPRSVVRAGPRITA
jgi:DNA ligase D-like protein (predicted 3'-phosphoesterase)